MPVKTTDVQPLAVALTMLALSCSAAAQSGASASAESSGLALTEVTVTADALDLDDSRPKSVSTATKTNLDTKDVPQTVSTLEVSKFKVYGINDLSVMLEGVPGVDTNYDMRGDGVMIRGFSADGSDIYRDGIRTSGQIRRSTANIERIEVLKGPASVLYGRGAGGGVVNMISKQANFESLSSLGMRLGSHGNRGGTVDINRVVSENLAVRLTADYEQADSFRRGIKNRNKMLSPSIAYDNRQGLTWLGQYTYDSVWRRPDRAPSYNNLPSDVSYRTAYAHPEDYVEDTMHMFRSVLGYDFGNDWSAKWTLGYHDANQDFDHLYNGSYCQPDGTRLSNGAACNTPGLMTFTRAWQVTNNKTFSNAFDVIGKAHTYGIDHDVLMGLEITQEKRSPDLATNPYVGGVDPYNPEWTSSKPAQIAATTSNRHSAKAQGLYVQDLISLTEQWKIMAGLRWEHYSFKTHNLINNGQRSYSGNALSPRLGIMWQPVPEHSIYASYSKNFSPYGGRGTLGVSVNEDVVFDAEPQYSRQIEVGVKSDWFDNALSSQLAVYNLEKYNVRYQPDAENDPFTWAMRGGERSRGMEASLTGRVAQHWYVRSGVGLQKAIVKRDVATPANEGKQLSNTARKTGNLFVRYVPRNDLYAEVGVTYRGSSYTNLANTSERPGYARYDASIGWRPLPWTLTLAVTNLTDKRYWRNSSMPGAPRTFLISGNYLF
ncbi:TonB-dependent receptor [Lampropedia aestuarii]|uniref:TonB-dependent receptor n=1 Tax=Lampropedia aestuarii TaxID=2562762 RepID=UPI00246888F9|nr:TonB-dependent siderophore receptor [Lampropedia aestuarii]MDH5858289.1 TonB-dependent siderophore receptor [Lampropedia aestuarii]